MSIAADPARTPALRPALLPRLLSFPNLLTLLFLLVITPFALTHALWVDEAQAFLIARDSHSFPDLFANLRYEGHPPLWHILLFLLTRLTTSIHAMQLLHVTLAAGSVYLLARFSRLPLLAKCLFPFGYYPFFEYGIIARNYQLAMLLTFAFCALWSQRRTAYLSLGVLLALLSLSHLMGVLLAAALGTMLLLDALFTRAGRAAIGQRYLRFSLGILLAAVGAALSAHLMNPPPDSGYAVGWHFTWELPKAKETLSILWDGLLPLPPRQLHFWDFHLTETTPATPLYGTLLAAAALLLLCWSWRASLVFILATLGQLAFSYVKFFGGVRHHGELFIALLAAFWIAWTPKKSAPVPAPSAPPAPTHDPASSPTRFNPPLAPSPLTLPQPLWKRTLSLIPKLALILFLGIHLYSASVAAYYATKAPFAAGQEAGLALQALLKPNDLLVADAEFVAPSLAIYLPGRTFTFPASKRTGTFIIWRKRDAWNRSGIYAAAQLANQRQQPVLFITAYPTTSLPPNTTDLGYYNNAILEMEHFAFYRITPAPR